MAAPQSSRSGVALASPSAARMTTDRIVMQQRRLRCLSLCNVFALLALQMAFSFGLAVKFMTSKPMMKFMWFTTGRFMKIFPFPVVCASLVCRRRRAFSMILYLIFTLTFPVAIVLTEDLMPVIAFGIVSLINLSIYSLWASFKFRLMENESFGAMKVVERRCLIQKTYSLIALHLLLSIAMAIVIGKVCIDSFLIRSVLLWLLTFTVCMVPLLLCSSVSLLLTFLDLFLSLLVQIMSCMTMWALLEAREDAVGKYIKVYDYVYCYQRFGDEDDWRCDYLL